MIPTTPRKKLTVARLRRYVSQVEWQAERRGIRHNGKPYRTFLGLIIKHHLVQIAPVAVSAAFCVRESLSAGRYISEIPAITMDH
jgi:hypothetical protein